MHTFSDILDESRGLTFPIGENDRGEVVYLDLMKSTHLLIAGSTGTGKSVLLHSILATLISHNSPDALPFVLYDSTVAELSIYNGTQHMYIPMITDPKKMCAVLKWIYSEILKRLSMMARNGNRNISSFNDDAWESFSDELPRIVIVIDDFATLISWMPETEKYINEVILKGRTVGIHLIAIAKTPTWKRAKKISSLFGTKVLFSLPLESDSKFLIGQGGAETLACYGDALFSGNGAPPLHVKPIMATEEELSAVITPLRMSAESSCSEKALQQIEQSLGYVASAKEETPEKEIFGDELLCNAADVIFETNQASVSMLQRRLKLGYACAARLIDQLEEYGLVGPYEDSNPRKILITKQQWEEVKKRYELDTNDKNVEYVVYYQNGQVTRMTPTPPHSYYEDRDLINEATKIVSDGVPYDLENEQSIHSIAVPQYLVICDNATAQTLGVTGYLEYVLRMHAGILWREGKDRLSMACLEKATKLMPYSSVGWQRKDYCRIVDWYVELGFFKKANEWNAWIEKNIPDPNNFAIEAFNRTVASCASMKTDLVEVGNLGSCCPVCAKYRNRIYSLSGKNWKFPRFPKDFHFQCGLGIYPFVEGVSEPTFNTKHYALYSRRPFRDDRTEEEKQNYKESLAQIEAENQHAHTADLNHIIYYWLKPKFPDDFPKSLSAFSRMRNANTPKYKDLVAKVECAGYRLPESLEDAVKLEDERTL